MAVLSFEFVGEILKCDQSSVSNES